MKIYYDLVLILNIAFDFLLLLTTSIILKRKVRLYRFILGSLIGGISIFALFISINSFTLFILKLLISIVMILVTFSFKNIKYFFINLFYLYITSIVLGGFLYLLNIEFSYKHDGLIFYNNGLSINFLVLVIFSPIILYLYVKQSKSLRLNYNNYYEVKLHYNNNEYDFCAFLDTGNKLYDPYHHRPIILVNTSLIDFSFENSLIVPYKTASGESILKCLKADKIVINKKYIVKDVLFGKCSNKFDIDGIDMILHSEIMGGYND